MSARATALILALLIAVSAFFTQKDLLRSEASAPNAPAEAYHAPSYFAFQANSFTSALNAVGGPSRDWNVLDPKIDAAAAMVYSLDDDMVLFGTRTYARWPAASLSKLLTTVVVAEDIGYQKKVTMTKEAIATYGDSVPFNENEEFSARDLARVMLMESSNDAAAAFEGLAGGTDVMTRLMNAKAKMLGLDQSVFFDASGVSEKNETSASDMVRLLKYLATAHPEILEWTRRTVFLFQPLNDPTSRTATNIDPFADDPRFLGGKTGTHPEAKENFAGIFTVNGRRLAVVVLGSNDRVRDTNALIDWAMRAYTFN